MSTWKRTPLPPNLSYRIDPLVGQQWKSRVNGRTVVIVSVNTLGTEVQAQTVGSKRKPSTVHISTLRSRFTPS